MIVVDASAIVTVFLNLGSSAARIRERLRQDEDAHVPHIFDVEVIQALRRHSLRGDLSEKNGKRILNLLQEIKVTRYPHTALLPRIWELRENVTAYDAAYIALAEVLNAPLVTMDAKLSQAPGIRATVELYE